MELANRDTSQVTWRSAGVGFRSRCRRRIQREVLARQLQIILKHGNDQVMVVALRQSGRGDGTHASCSRQNNRKAPAVRGVVFQV